MKCLAAATASREVARGVRPPSPPPPERRPLREAIGFRTFANPRKQGNAGLGIAIAYLSRIGADVAIPLTDTRRYDLIIVHDDDGMERVQVKTTNDEGAVQLRRSPAHGRRKQEPGQDPSLRPDGRRVALRRLRRRHRLHDPDHRNQQPVLADPRPEV